MPNVTFYSPGTFMSECTTVDTALTDPASIQHLAQGITERHGAKPYAFKIEGDPHCYWFGANRILTRDDIPDTPENRILRQNMEWNNIDRIIENTNSWRFTAPFRDGTDVVLP